MSSGHGIGHAFAVILMHVFPFLLLLELGIHPQRMQKCNFEVGYSVSKHFLFFISNLSYINYECSLIGYCSSNDCFVSNCKDSRSHLEWMNQWMCPCTKSVLETAHSTERQISLWMELIVTWNFHARRWCEFVQESSLGIIYSKHPELETSPN